MRLGVLTALWGRHHITRPMLRQVHACAIELGTLDMTAVVSCQEDAMLAKWARFNVVTAANDPLGAKFNAGMQMASIWDVAGVVILGSDDLPHPNLFRAWAKGLEDGYDFQGLRDTYVHDVDSGETIHWHGYGDRRPSWGHTEGEPHGAGRCLSRRVLDALDWQPWEPSLNRGLDASMMKRLPDGEWKRRSVTMAEIGAPLLGLVDQRGNSMNPLSAFRGIGAECSDVDLPAECAGWL